MFIRKAKKLFTLSFLITVLFSSLNALGSSDIGYTINRGSFTVTVRFGFDDHFMSKEPNKLDQTFMQLTQWIWDNRKQLENTQSNHEIWATANDREQSFIIYSSEKSEQIRKFTFSKGQLAQKIIQEISQDTDFKITNPNNKTHLILIVTKEHDFPLLPDQQLTQKSPGYFTIGAIPGGCHNPSRKFNGIQYSCAFLFWADDQTAKTFKPNNQQHKINIPLNQKAIKQFLGEIH